MKLPGPDHPITIARNPKRVRVSFAGTTIADTTQALTLQGGELPGGALYPARRRQDGPAQGRRRMPAIARTKATPVIFRLRPDGRTAENAVWSYEQPFPAMAEIKDYLAFYPSRVDKIEEG